MSNPCRDPRKPISPTVSVKSGRLRIVPVKANSSKHGSLRSSDNAPMPIDIKPKIEKPSQPKPVFRKIFSVKHVVRRRKQRYINGTGDEPGSLWVSLDSPDSSISVSEESSESARPEPKRRRLYTKSGRSYSPTVSS